MPTHITVNAAALGQVLAALVGPPHLIRELQATRGMPVWDNEPPNPIDTLMTEYVAALAAEIRGTPPTTP